MLTLVCVVLVCFTGISVAIPTTHAPEVPCICTMDYTPVCGIDQKTYGNKCALDCAGVTLLHDGECRPPCLCPRIYRPVCGQDGKTYSNQCMLNCAGVAMFQEGECAAVTQQAVVPEDDIPCICTFIYLPVCGVDGITYGNDCNRKCVNVALAHDGPCDSLTTKAPLTKQ